MKQINIDLNNLNVEQLKAYLQLVELSQQEKPITLTPVSKPLSTKADPLTDKVDKLAQYIRQSKECLTFTGLLKAAKVKISFSQQPKAKELLAGKYKVRSFYRKKRFYFHSDLWVGKPIRKSLNPLAAARLSFIGKLGNKLTNQGMERSEAFKIAADKWTAQQFKL